LIGVNEALLSKDPTYWAEDEVFLQASNLAKGFSAVNDRAERGIALLQDYNKLLTIDEEQFQFLMQVVSEHRKLLLTAPKKILLHKLLLGMIHNIMLCYFFKLWFQSCKSGRALQVGFGFGPDSGLSLRNISGLNRA